MPKDEAIAYFTEKDDPYKLELLEGLKDGRSLSIHKVILPICAAARIFLIQALLKAVKLTNIAGAYWSGDEKNKMLTRIYGITFPTQKELDEYLHLLEEAKKRDHRKLGKELELFTFSEKVGSGLPLWLPKGAMLRERLQQFLQKAQMESGYLPVITPHIGSKQLYVLQATGKNMVRIVSSPLLPRRKARSSC